MGTPSSRRVGAHVAHGGVVAGGKAEADPGFLDAAGHGPGGRAISTPSASSTSAEPVREDAARPPCLQTGTPAPATTRAAMVETLMVPARSPPVPQVSTSLRPHVVGDGHGLGHLEHGPQHAGELLGRLALAPQPEDERRHLRRAGRSLQDFPQRRRRLLRAQVVARGHSPEDRRPAPDVGQAHPGHGSPPGGQAAWWGTASGTPQSY